MQVALGLEYMQYMELVYRDLKPENILINVNGYLKVRDVTAGDAASVFRSIDNSQPTSVIFVVIYDAMIQKNLQRCRHGLWRYSVPRN